MTEKELDKHRKSKVIKLVYKKVNKTYGGYAAVYWFGNYVVFPSNKNNKKEAVNGLIDYLIGHLESLRVK